MTANNQLNRNAKGLGIPNLRSRQNAANHFSEKKFFGVSGKPVRSVSAVKVADFAQYLNGVKILFCSDASRLTKQVLGKRYPFCQKMGTKAEKCGFPKKSHLAEKKKEAR